MHGEWLQRRARPVGRRCRGCRVVLLRTGDILSGGINVAVDFDFTLRGLAYLTQADATGFARKWRQVVDSKGSLTH